MIVTYSLEFIKHSINHLISIHCTYLDSFQCKHIHMYDADWSLYPFLHNEYYVITVSIRVCALPVLAIHSI